MLTFLKAQLSSLSASILDFLVTVVFKEFFYMQALSAGILGSVAGGVFNFCLNRVWTFQSTKKSARKQFAKYVMVWIGSLILNAGGLFLLLTFTKLHYVVCKIIVSLLVGVFYNYLLQRNVVFR